MKKLILFILFPISLYSQSTVKEAKYDAVSSGIFLWLDPNDTTVLSLKGSHLKRIAVFVDDTLALGLHNLDLSDLLLHPDTLQAVQFSDSLGKPIVGLVSSNYFMSHMAEGFTFPLNPKYSKGSIPGFEYSSILYRVNKKTMVYVIQSREPYICSGIKKIKKKRISRKKYKVILPAYFSGLPRMKG